MGIQHAVPFPKSPPSWPRIRDAAKCAGLELATRMIDNLPAFPDEEPEEGWRELRVASLHGMMTLRRTADGIDLVTWGNADGNLQADTQQLLAILKQLGDES